MNHCTGYTALAAMLLLGGCSGGEGSPSAPAAPASASTGSGPGVLVGRVLFEGAVPSPRRITVNKDQEACQYADVEVQEVLVSADNALAGVVIEIQEVQPRPGQAEGEYVIRQKDCGFHPELLVVPDGATLTIHNEDAVMHNVNAGQWNLAQPAGFRPLTQTMRFMRRPFVRIHCNIHSWMEAWIYVARSPCYGTTGADGRFRVEGIPPGAYTVTAIHPKLGTQQFEITVGVGQTVEHDLTFRPS